MVGLRYKGTPIGDKVKHPDFQDEKKGQNRRWENFQAGICLPGEGPAAGLNQAGPKTRTGLGIRALARTGLQWF